MLDIAWDEREREIYVVNMFWWWDIYVEKNIYITYEDINRPLQRYYVNRLYYFCGETPMDFQSIEVSPSLASSIGSIGFLLHLDKPDFIEIWIRCFSPLKSIKEIGGENEFTGLFLATVCCEVIMKISLMTYPRELSEQTFNQIKIILMNVRPQKKRVITKRTKFKSLKRTRKNLWTFYIGYETPEIIINFLHRLRDASRFCEFERLGKKEMEVELYYEWLKVGSILVLDIKCCNSYGTDPVAKPPFKAILLTDFSSPVLTIAAAEFCN